MFFLEWFCLRIQRLLVIHLVQVDLMDVTEAKGVVLSGSSAMEVGDGYVYHYEMEQPLILFHNIRRLNKIAKQFLLIPHWKTAKL